MVNIALERISDNSTGMPDCWHVDAEGKSSPEIYQKHFGLPRYKRNDKRLLEKALSRATRREHFMSRLLHYRNLGAAIMLAGDNSVSPEAHALARHDLGWHLRNEDELTEVAKLSVEDLKAKLSDLLAHQRDKEDKSHQPKIQALAKRSNTTPESAYEVMAKCALESWLRARDELNQWAELEEPARQLLAEVLFTGFTFFGKAALEEVNSIEPAALEYYSSFLGSRSRSAREASAPKKLVNAPPAASKARLVDELLTVGADVEPSASIDQTIAPEVLAEESPTPESLQELYALIADIGVRAQTDPNVGAEPGQRMLELLEEHLQRLAAMRAQLSAEDVWALIERYCDAVLQMTNALRFEISEQRDLVPVLRAAWKTCVIAAMQEGQARGWFEINLTERQHLPEYMDRFKAEEARIAVASNEINEIRGQLAEAKYTARASLKARETHQNNEINSANQALEIIRVEVAHRLLPGGRTLDELMDDESLLSELHQDVENLQSGSVRDLQLLMEETRAMALPEFPAPQTASEAIQNLDPMTEAAAPSGLEILVEVADSQPEPSLLQNSGVEETASAQQPLSQQTPARKVLAVEAEIRELTPDETPIISASPVAADGLYGTQQRVQGSVTSVDEAIKHLRWTDSREEAQQAFRIAYEKYSQVPRYVIEAVALHWIEAGQLPVAAQMLKDANDSTLLSEQVLDYRLLRSAFYGAHLWPKDREALSKVQRNLNLLNQQELEDELARKPVGKVVPYLLVCATLQPALFAGGQTQAATLLRLAADHFDEHLNRLINLTADFSLRGGRLDLDLLRNEQAQEVHVAVAKLQDQVTAWVDRNQQRTNRWHALRLALRNCISHPAVGDAIEAIRAGERGDSAAVQNFADTYGSHTASRLLFDELVTQIREDSPVSDTIDSQAYTTFCHQMDGLVAIARAWLLEVAPSVMRPNDVQDFVRKFRTLLAHSIHSMEGHTAYDDLEHRAGRALLLRALTRLQAAFKSSINDVWSFDQTDATFELPKELAHLDMSMGEVGGDLRLEWFAMRSISADWLSDMADLARRMQAHRLLLLLLRQLDDADGSRSAELDGVGNDIARARAELMKASEQFRKLSLQALSVDMISEETHLSNVDVIKDWRSDLSERKPFVDVSDIDRDIQARVQSLEKLLNSSASQLEEELDRELLAFRLKVGADGVPDEWEARARNALQTRSLALVRELINQLKEYGDRNARLLDAGLQGNAELTSFLEVEAPLYELLHEHRNPREAGDRVLAEQPGGLDYSANRAEFKNAIEILMEWRAKGKNKKRDLDLSTYEGIVKVLQFLGLEAQYKQGRDKVLTDCEYSDSGDLRRLKVRVLRPTLPKGFPLFEGRVGAPLPLNVVFVQGAWSQAGLIDLIERHGQPDRGVLMIGHPLSPQERKEFSAFCRERRCTIFLLDPVILSYVATAAHQQEALETFLRVSAAWTFFNPYTNGDARLPAPPEMRFGRERDIASLVEPRGAALVYGGRQLGKTTLLNAAVQEFVKRDPQHHHAYYMAMDRHGKFQHVVERGFDVKKPLFKELFQMLVEDNVLVSNSSNAQIEPEDRLRQEFLRPGDSRVLFCLDEIDSVLNKDAASNFEVVRALKALVNDPNNRFRVVLAGLNNVNRFQTYPNVPLEQLGSPLNIGILPSSDARNLIQQPLLALGYRFEDAELVDRIMAFTNCHPSLLHIFCGELVEQLAREASRRDDPRRIRANDVESIENNSAVRRLSGDRFDMTLNLDKRYTVAIYGLIAEYGQGIGKFTVSKALEIARGWVPDEFQQMSESGFEGILRELVGLGVLRVDDPSKRTYALRNQSILQLIGSTNDIMHKLQQAIQGLKDHDQDVLTCHAKGPRELPSPLSLQDERTILLAKPPEGSPNYSVSLIMGTPALGMMKVQEGFNAISEFQSGSSTSKYHTQVVKDAASLDLVRFAGILDTAIDSWATADPAVVLVPLEECSSIDRMLDLVSIANEKAANASALKHPLRVVFLLGPRSMWKWQTNSWLTSMPNEIGGQVELNRWSRYACESLLEQLGMSVTSEQGDRLRNATEGWYEHLIRFMEAKKKKQSASSFDDFAGTFTSTAELPPKDFHKFVQSSGMNSMAWSLPLASQLSEFELLENFSRDDVQGAIEVMGEESLGSSLLAEQADAVVRWWAALRLVEVNTKAKSKAAGRGDSVTYSFLPSIQRAIREHKSVVVASEASA
jgi:hypothetical protein